jgi:hypothetical protein
MAPLPVITGVFRVAQTWTVAGTPRAANVMHFSAPTLTVVTLGTLLDAKVTSSMFGCVASQCQVKGWEIIPLDGTTPTYIKNVTTARGGQGAGTGMPAVACVVSLRTGLRGPAGRGRVYLPWVSEDNFASGIIDAAAVSATLAGWNTFNTQMIAGGATLGVASYAHSSFSPITSLSISTKAATQRRRQDVI